MEVEEPSEGMKTVVNQNPTKKEPSASALPSACGERKGRLVSVERTAKNV